LPGLTAFTKGGSLDFAAKYRLPFRELGLAIGLAGAANLDLLIRHHPALFKNAGSLQCKVEAVSEYVPLQDSITEFWILGKNREAATWTEHAEISLVMLATSLEPDGFLTL
jgi:hypothetical protein